MISEPDYENLRSYQRDRAVQAWSFGVAIPLTILIWILLTWHLFALNLTGVGEQKPEHIFDITSSIIEPHPKQHQSVPESHPKVPPPPTAPKPQPQLAQKQAVVPRPVARPTELAQIVPHAPPQPRSVPEHTRQAALAEQLAQQEVAFAREAQQLNNSRSPVDVATADPNLHQQINTQFKNEFAGTRVLEGKGEGYMEPLRRWNDGGAHCYYGRYTWVYPTGGTETGDVPWAFCFTPQQDPFTHGIHEFPFPLPLPGYRLPSGVQLLPIEKAVYDDWLAHQ